MSILIKGMKMPESCVDCPMFDWDLEYLKCKANDKYFKANGEWRKGIESTCPLIEVLPHGDLIDKDATMNEILEERGLDTACWFAGIVNDMPAVIPADKDGET